MIKNILREAGLSVSTEDVIKNIPEVYLKNPNEYSKEIVECAKLLEPKKSTIIKVYHGTKDANLMPNPNFANPDNDYGNGFYLSNELSKALEWSMSNYTTGSCGYAYEYEMDTSGLNILDLRKQDPLVWCAVLLTHRPVIELTGYLKEVANAVVSNYYIDVQKYDAVLGYRADDSYYMYTEDFISGRITLETFEHALALGKLGLQLCLKSPLAFSRLNFCCRKKATQEDRNRYKNRDRLARQEYKALQHSKQTGKYIVKILNERGLL